MNLTSPWGPSGWRPLAHINQDLIYVGVIAPHTCRAWVGTLCTSFQAWVVTLGHLDDMRLDEKKNLGLSLNEKKNLWAFSRWK